MSMHLIANEEFVTAKESSIRGGVDIKKEARGRLARIMIVHQIYNKCSTELVGRAMKQIYEKTLVQIGAQDHISMQQEKLKCIMVLIGTFSCSLNQGMLKTPQ